MLQGRRLPDFHPGTGGRNDPRAKHDQLGDCFRPGGELQFANFLSTLKDPDTRRLSGAPCCQNFAFPDGCGGNWLWCLWGADEQQMKTSFEIISLQAPANARRDLKGLLAQGK